jgi:hypothetical protein
MSPWLLMSKMFENAEFLPVSLCSLLGLRSLK